jgi:hypothetical protein
MNGQHHALDIIAPWKEPPVPIRQEMGWALGPVWRTEKYLQRQRIEPRPFSPSFILTEVFLLFLIKV